MRRWRSRGDSGSAALETVILAPPMLAILALAMIGARIQLAAGSIEGAAHDAARAASLARTPGEARAAANDMAWYTLNGQGLRCSSLTVGVDTGHWPTAGTSGSVRATVTCVVSYADLVAGGIPAGEKTLESSFVSAVDTFRSRS